MYQQPLLRKNQDTQMLGKRGSLAGRLIVVPGGSGYIGSVLVRKLLRSGAHVRVLERFIYGDLPLRDIATHPRLEIISGDCRKISTAVRACDGADSLVYLSAIVGDPACEQDPVAAVEINYAATRMIAEVMMANTSSQMVFASSCSVYGKATELADEESALNPVSLYARTKINSERALLNARTSSFHPTVLRFATVFGLSPRPRFDLVVNMLSAQAASHESITIYNESQWRPFIHVCDVARAIMAILEAPVSEVSGEIFNVGDQRMNFSLGQLAEEIRRIVPGTSVQYVENSDRRDYRVSFEKLRSRLQFECVHDLRFGVEEICSAITSGTIESYRDPAYHNQRFLKNAGSLANNTCLEPMMMALSQGETADCRCATAHSAA